MSIVWICTLFCYVIAGILQSDPAKKKDSKLGLLVAFVGALVNLPNAIVALVGIASLEEPVSETQAQTTDGGSAYYGAPPHGQSGQYGAQDGRDLRY